jgi:predicted nucleic acid-binding protein
MILVDTSIWIAARKQPLVAETLRQLLDADEVTLALPVRLELFAGTPAHQRKEFKRSFSGIPVIYPTEETWKQMPEWIARATDAGEHFGLANLLIALLATELGGLVWSFDKDFQRMERLKFVSLYELPH